MLKNISNKFLIFLIFLFFIFIIFNTTVFASDTYDFAFSYNNDYYTVTLPIDVSTYEHRFVFAYKSSSDTYNYYIMLSNNPFFYNYTGSYGNPSYSSDGSVLIRTFERNIPWTTNISFLGSLVEDTPEFSFPLRDKSKYILMYSDYDIVDSLSGEVVFQGAPVTVEQVTIPEIQQVGEIPQVIAEVLKILIPIGLIVLSIGLVIYLTRLVISRLQ